MSDATPNAPSGTASKSAEAAARRLALLRLLVFGIWLAKLVNAPLRDLAVLPADMMQPPLLLQFVPSSWWATILTPTVLTVLHGVLLVLLTLTLAGPPLRIIGWATIVLLTLQQGLIRSFGASGHSEVVPLLAAYVLVAWPSADRLTWWARPPALRPAALYDAGVMLVATICCWTYAATGIYRLAHHGLDMLSGNWMSLYIVRNSFRYGTGGSAIWVLRHPGLRWLWQAGAVVMTAFEVSAPLALIVPRFRVLWLLFVVGFHLGNAAFLDVFFWESMLITASALLALPEPRLLTGSKTRLEMQL